MNFLILGIFAKIDLYATILYAVQLLTIARFIGTIMDTLLALKMNINPLASMVLFMIVYIYYFTIKKETYREFDCIK